MNKEIKEITSELQDLIQRVRGIALRIGDYEIVDKMDDLSKEAEESRLHMEFHLSGQNDD
jgi:hypothetical protein